MRYDDNNVVEARIIGSYALPLAPHVDVTIQGPFPLTPAEWAQFKRLLDTMSRGLVDDANPTPA